MKYQGKGIFIALLSLTVIAASGSFSLGQITEAATQNDENAFLKGHVEATLFDNEGNIKAYRQGDNAIVVLGMNLLVTEITLPAITGGLTSTVNGELSHMQIGTGGETGATATQTGLTTALVGCEDTISAVSTGATVPVSNASIDIVYTATFSSADNASCETASIDEVIITGGAGGDMFARNTFALLTIGSGESLQIDWTFTFLDS